MGEHKILRCNDCEQFANVGKIRPEFDEGHRPGDRELTIQFLYRHEGHDIELVGEYGGTQGRWLATSKENGWEEFEKESY